MLLGRISKHYSQPHTEEQNFPILLISQTYVFEGQIRQMLKSVRKELISARIICLRIVVLTKTQGKEAA